MRISDWSSDVCSSDLNAPPRGMAPRRHGHRQLGRSRGRSPPGRMIAGILGALAVSTVERLWRSEEHTSELQSLMRISYAVFCLKKKNTNKTHYNTCTNTYKEQHYVKG